MRIDYEWYWIIWDEVNQDWFFEWKSDKKRIECQNYGTNQE